MAQTSQVFETCEVLCCAGIGCLREGLQWKARSEMQVRAQRRVPECSEDLERKARWPLGATRHGFLKSRKSIAERPPVWQ